jgi:A/G-specific adenine glycosylase
VRRPKRGVPQVGAAAAAVERDGRILLVQRPSAGLLAGLWTLPSVELTDGVPHDEALRAYMLSEYGLEVAVGDSVGTVQHVFTHRRLRLHVYRCSLRAGVGGEPRNGLARWVARGRLGAYACAAVDRKAFAALAAQKKPRATRLRGPRSRRVS